MLPDLLEVLQALVLPPHDGRHPPQRRPLQLLAAVQRVPELEQPDVVLGHVVDEVAGGVDLSQRQLVMVLAATIEVLWFMCFQIHKLNRSTPCHKEHS